MEIQEDFEDAFPYTPCIEQSPMRVLSLFDGIGAGTYFFMMRFFNVNDNF